MKFTLVAVAAFTGLALASPIEELDKRYTDWSGCMTTCNTPTCAIKNCWSWCNKVCCGQYWNPSTCPGTT